MIENLDEKYLGTKPLNHSCWSDISYPPSLLCHHFEPPKIEYTWIDKLTIQYKIAEIYTITSQEEELVTYDFLHRWYVWYGYGEHLIVHKRVLEKFTKMCPNDFEVTPVIIENLKSEPQAFINKDFVYINVLHKVRAVDKEKTRVIFNKEDFWWTIIVQYKEDCMDSHLLAVDNRTSAILFDPKLAKEFANSKGVTFLCSGKL